ncbi:hypothetical protein ACFSL6_07295 [Paenibacillus thailandensis]|uniref:ABC transporter permease n=1 Tax=Paenibacillus thailandensis TaxID=393250 RepID=A0ABW5R3E5_9BACL
MNKIGAVMRMHYRDKWSWFLIPVIILFASFAINLLIGYLVQEEEGMRSGGVTSVYVYAFIAGIIAPSQTFSFAIGLSVRRRDFFWGTACTMAVFSFTAAAMLTVLSFVEAEWTGGWGVKLGFFHLPYLNDGNAAVQLLIAFSLLLHMYMAGFTLVALFRRFGRKGMFTFWIAAILLGTLASFILTYMELWGAIGEWLVSHSASYYAAWLLPLTAIYGIVSYLVLRKAV